MNEGILKTSARWVSEIRYVDAEATVKLIFAPIVIPLITRLEKRFTQYEMKQIAELSTGYAIRLYELLICWRTTGKTPVIELSEFRQKMGVLDSEYQRMYDFKNTFWNHLSNKLMSIQTSSRPTNSTKKDV